MTPDGVHVQPHFSPYPRPRAPRNPDVALAARTDACVLLTGDATSAKKLAYQLHLHGGWRHGAFIVIACSSGPPDLERRIMDAVFDYAARRDLGPLRLVQAGTVLLQDVNELPLPVQRRLAARLSDQWASPRPGRSRRRLIASTTEPLFDRVVAGTFDDSLYYRLNMMQFSVPVAD